MIIRNTASLGSGRLTVKAGASVTLDVLGDNVRVGEIALEPGGRLDFGYGRITLQAGGYSLTSIRQWLLGGYVANWAGPSGFNAKPASSIPGSGLGYLLNSDNSLTVGFAVAGDSNLDGEVDILDLVKFLASGKFDTAQTSSWDQGDFNYDGIVDVLDVAAITLNNRLDCGSYIPTSRSATLTGSSTTLTATDLAFLALAVDNPSSGSVTTAKKLRLGFV
jgi:hypothetical protein